MRVTSFFADVLILVAVHTAAGADPPKDDPEVAKLVKDLGSPRFAVREVAERTLVELGSKARAAVLAGTKDADPEVARRCKDILPRARAAERKAFVDGKLDWPAPAGTRFKDLVGDTKDARELFADIADDDRRAGLAAQAVADPGQAAKLYRAEVARLDARDRQALVGVKAEGRGINRLNIFQEESRRAVPAGDVALALFLGALPFPDGAADPAGDRFLTAGFADLVSGPNRGPARKLFAAWLERRRARMVLGDGVEAALVTDLPEATPAARRVAGDPKATGAEVGMAVLLLARHGTKDDLALLSALRADARVFRITDGGPSASTECQVRDLAAAASLALRGQKVSDWFTLRTSTTWWAAQGMKPVESPLGFSDPEVREAALKKAWEWLDKQPGAPPPPKK
jgi:hypothetical protein